MPEASPLHLKLMATRSLLNLLKRLFRQVQYRAIPQQAEFMMLIKRQSFLRERTYHIITKVS